MTATHLAILAAVVVVVLVILDARRRRKRDADPELRRLRQLCRRIRLFRLQQADLAAGRRFAEAPVELEPELRAAVGRATKVVVVPRGGRLTGPVEHSGAPRASFWTLVIACNDGIEHHLADTERRDHATLVARELGALLGLPVEQV